MGQHNPSADVSDPSIITFRFTGTGAMWGPIADKLNAMIDAINGNRVTTGQGMHHTRTPLGTTLRSTAAIAVPSVCLAGYQKWESAADVAKEKAAAASEDNPDPDLRSNATVFASASLDLSQDADNEDDTDGDGETTP